MPDHNNELETKIKTWRSAFRGYIWLGAPLPLLFVCAGYLTSDLKMICRLITGSLLMLNLFIMYWRQDGIVQAIKKQEGFTKLPIWKRLLVKLVFLILAILLIIFLLNPLIPIYIQGLLACAYYLAATITWYQRIKEHKKE